MHCLGEEVGHASCMCRRMDVTHLQCGSRFSHPGHLDDDRLAVIAVADQLGLRLLRQLQLLRLLHCLKGDRICAVKSVRGPAAPPRHINAFAMCRRKIGNCLCNAGV